MLHLVVAGIHEARPIIDHYRMVALKGEHAFKIYTAEALILIVSGIGKPAAAAAVGYLQALARQDGPRAWLNIGIAGHQQLDIAQGFIAHRIQDQATGRCYYPPQVLPFAARSSNLITVDHVERDYAADSGYDMEASAFYSAAIRTSTAEFIQSYKVVSDHSQQSVEKITKGSMTQNIAARLDEITPLIATLQTEIARYRKIHAASPHFDAIVRTWHFTETQRSQLKTLLRCAKVHFKDGLPSQINVASHANAKSFLSALAKTLAAHQVVF